MSAVQARAAVNQHVQEMSKECSDPAKCWASVRDGMPRLYAAAFSQTDNSGSAAEPAPLPNSAPPAAYQFHLPMMRLPTSTTKDEFNIAWRANGSTATPVNTKAIFDSLVGFYISKGMTQGQAEKAVSDKFTMLAPVK